MWVLDYVIVHELAHLREAGHGPRFQALVDRYPRAERARGFLIAKSGSADPDDVDDEVEDTMAGVGADDPPPAIPSTRDGPGATRERVAGAGRRAGAAVRPLSGGQRSGWAAHRRAVGSDWRRSALIGSPQDSQRP